ncbi:MAG TPA: hypothetical protein VGB63_13250 [Pedobacter sp.]|jgi:hypothetical protein
MELAEIKEIKDKVKPFLPDGYVRQIQSRLSQKGISKSVGTISNVCNPEKGNYDLDILSEAIRLAEEEKQKIQGLALQANNL